MENKFILVTGAGSIGSELIRQLCVKNKVFILDHDETAFFDLYEELKQKGFDVCGKIGDIRDENVFDDIKDKNGYPDMIFHCAALKHVTPSEWNTIEYVKTNILGTANILDFAVREGIPLINISTDKVVNAENIMGLTKKIAEKMVKRERRNSVRFGNVMGSRGSVLPIWQAQIDKNESLTITDSRMERYMMTIPQAVELVIEASKMPQDGRIVILDMGQPIKIKELAEAILKASGKDLGIKEIGIRPGETLTERLMTEDEEKRATKEGKFWVIL